MGLPRFITETITFIYNDFEYQEISYNNFFINYEEEYTENEIVIATQSELIENYNFSDIKVIIIDKYAFTVPQLRKILKVNFYGYNEVNNAKRSDIKLRFKVDEFEIYTDTSLQSIQSLIRDMKLRSLED
jgi:hypothetical protein